MLESTRFLLTVEMNLLNLKERKKKKENKVHITYIHSFKKWQNIA